MADTTTRIGRERYKMTITSSKGNTLIADEPPHLGGKDLGFSPFELLASSLGACTSATLRMYADRKGWELDEIIARVSVERDDKADKTLFIRHIELKGELTQEQCARLLEIAEKCPVHRALHGKIEIETIAN
ncbi:OsmC family protein [Flavobacterium selenitireducens]|uniref:OsmC family protein n=1 Tax=Flavobacterium selenitireducens TaxID=2722704 RepID=UPI00168A8906|nr:OsmC family protein [Flavobacterium selenitireducens]MBD3581014.1 OsmC family protein [Flavobacterium selenitireducens]